MAGFASTTHPAFAPHARWLDQEGGGSIATCATLNAWAREAALALPDGTPLRFVDTSPRHEPALDYERRIARAGVIAVRGESLHDFCNALCWLAFPRTKAALNAIHVAEADPSRCSGSRTRSRDAASLLDESGMLVACADRDLMGRWDARDWRAAFGEPGCAGAPRLRALAIGHGLLAKCVAPWRSITAHALVVPLPADLLPDEPRALAEALDAAAAARIAEAGAAFSPGGLRPLPVAALPEWDRDGQGARRFDDASVFRPPCAQRSAPMHAGAVMLR